MRPSKIDKLAKLLLAMAEVRLGLKCKQRVPDSSEMHRSLVGRNVIPALHDYTFLPHQSTTCFPFKYITGRIISVMKVAKPRPKIIVHDIGSQKATEGDFT